MSDVAEIYNQQAMQIILHAGDGRFAVMNALDAVAKGDLEDAQQQLQKAYAEIQQAHQVQTSILQQIACGELEQEYSVLFSHAQDTLMTIYSEYNLAQKLLKITDSLMRRIENGKQ